MIRRLLVVAALATVAGAAAILGLSAALDVRWDPQAAVGQAIAAVFLGQYPVEMGAARNIVEREG